MGSRKGTSWCQTNLWRLVVLLLAAASFLVLVPLSYHRIYNNVERDGTINIKQTGTTDSSNGTNDNHTVNNTIEIIDKDEVNTSSNATNDHSYVNNSVEIVTRNGTNISSTVTNDTTTFNNSICNTVRNDTTTFRSVSGLFAIITGAENSGTTMVSQFIMSVPNLFGAFECGMLLPNKPSGFSNIHPFYEWMGKNWSWGLTQAQLEELTSCTCHAEMYVKLRQMSPIYRYPNNSSMIIDKTPRYSYTLSDIMARAPGIPVIVTRKSGEDQWQSWKKRTGSELKERYNRVKNGIRKAIEKYPNLIMVINTTELYEDPNRVMDQVFKFLQLDWKSEYLTMDAVNTKNKAVGLPRVQPFNPETAKNNTNTETPKFGGKRD